MSALVQMLVGSTPGAPAVVNDHEYSPSIVVSFSSSSPEDPGRVGDERVEIAGRGERPPTSLRRRSRPAVDEAPRAVTVITIESGWMRSLNTAAIVDPTSTWDTSVPGDVHSTVGARIVIGIENWVDPVVGGAEC